MGITELAIISFGLAMDSCTMAICLGMSMKKFEWKNSIIIGFWFGFFQALMPLLGFLLGSTFADFIDKIGHFITFFVLCFIGINMINDDEKEYSVVKSRDFTIKGIIILAIATSIDALAVGVTFSFLQVNMKIAFILIGSITFSLSCLGTKVGNIIVKKLLGKKYEKYISYIGAIILITMGFKVLLEHLQLFN